LYIEHIHLLLGGGGGGKEVKGLVEDMGGGVAKFTYMMIYIRHTTYSSSIHEAYIIIVLLVT
jgi:hypothetical protein